MKSKRAEEFINNSSELIDGLEWMIDTSTARRAVELAEQDTEEEVTHYRKELEESKRREELARKVIDDQRKKIEALKARAVEAHRKCCFFRNDSSNECANTATQCGEHSCFYMDNFIQKFNER